MTYLELTCRTALWAVFLAAVFGKANPRGLRGLASELTPVTWLPAQFAMPAAVGVITVEGGTVVALSASRSVILGYGMAIAALGAFTATAADALRRGERLRCRCFGADAGPVGGSQIARNCGLIAVALTALGSRLSGLGAAGWPGPVGTAAALASGLAIAIAVVRWDDLAYLCGPDPRRRIT
jgi:hypothetical protein